jgi:basic membrane protein A
MKKKVVSLLLACAMTISLAACGAKSTKESGKSDKNIKIGMVTDVGGVNDGSFNQSAWEGLQKAEKDLGIKVDYLESKNDADYQPNIETFVDGGYDMIICIGYALAPALKKEAKANPDQKFAIVDDASLADAKNVTSLMFEAGQSSYLVGYTAGLTTKSNNIGFVLGMSTAMMHEFGYGYVAGAIDANPDITVQAVNANSFSDSAAGKSAANAMIAKGADVIFHAAGATGLGAIDACKEAGIWAIGVDSDQSKVAPKTILTSAMKRVDNAVYSLCQDTVKGKVKAGVETFDITDGGVDIAPTTDNIDPEVLEKVQAKKQELIDGKVVVPKTEKEFVKKYGKGKYTLNKEAK